MNDDTMFRVAPTFPLDDQRIRKRSHQRMLASPITWGSLIATFGLAFALQANGLGMMFMLLVTTFVLSRFWRAQTAKMHATSIRELVRESNIAQDHELVQIIRTLDDRGVHSYAITLGRFLLLKQKIEGELHQRDHLAPFAEEVEKGVDGICTEVCREITEQMAREAQLGDVLTSRNKERLERMESARREAHASILHAYTTLYQTHAELVGLNPRTLASPESSPPDLPSGQRLRELVAKLRDESEVITRTQQRIRDTIGPGPESPIDQDAPPDSPSSPGYSSPPPVSETPRSH